MPTIPVSQVASTSIDTAGISVATAPPSADNPRAGTIYDPTILAAAVPIWFHPTRKGHYLMLAAKRWYDATPDGGTPGGYTAYTEDAAPSWFLIDGPTGTRFTIPGYPIHPPMRTTVTSATLTGAVSRPPGYVYLLHQAQIGGSDQAVLQYVYASMTDSIEVCAEEVLPTVEVDGDTVVFGQGIEYSTPYLHLYGTDSAGRLYRIRKSWGEVGANKPNPNRHIGPNAPRGWEYYAGWGYSYDAAEIAPIQAGLTNDRPVSFALYRNATLMSTVLKDGTTYTGQLWTSKGGRPWTQTKAAIALGSSADDSYVGAGLRLMPQLGADATTVGAAVAGVPYLVTTYAEESGVSRLLNSWDVWKMAL